MKAERILITPSIAKKMLEANINNRKVDKDKLYHYTRDMKNERWKEDTGEALQIAKSGRILNGQHRLNSLIAANMSFYFLVVSELEEHVFDVIDTGKPRSANDVFHISGITSNNTLPSMIQLYNVLRNTNNLQTGGSYSKIRLSNSMLLEKYYERKDFWNSTSKLSLKWYHNFSKVMSPQVIGGMFSYFYDLSQDDSFDFMEQLSTGTKITNHTIIILRNRLIEDRLSSTKMTTEYKHNLIIKTWNCYRKGIELKVLKHDATLLNIKAI